MNISTQMISRFLHEAEFELPTDTFEIDHQIKEKKKVKFKHIGMERKYKNLRWIFGIIDSSQEDAP